MKQNQIIERIKYFFIKLISIKIIGWFGTATVLLFFRLLPWWGWLIVSGMCFAARTTEKLLTKYLESYSNSYSPSPPPPPGFLTDEITKEEDGYPPPPPPPPPRHPNRKDL